MDIKRMHDMIETLTECAKHEFDKGIENIDAEEMGKVTDMIKDLAEAEYYRKISVAMDESEYGEDYDYRGAYDEHSRKGYRGQMRDSRGRYMSRRRGYDEPPYMMTPHMYKEHDPEWYRDMDREEMGRMYYSGGSSQSSGQSNNWNMGGNRGGQSSSRSENARRNYTETKQMGKSSGMENKQENMKNLEEYLKELSTEISELVGEMDASEKTMMKQKLSTLMQKIQ